ncbi:MAG: MerR family transcriptional regulator, partial [bacterium]|nr:MerR family transcriptional regulator [bacterium]
MLSIGEFARFGEVSPRMLRHYDSLGLLVPAHTDASSGYRYYDADQLPRLNLLLALKGLGLTLEQLGPVLDSAVGTDDLRRMLEESRARVRAQLAADTARLDGIERRLRMLEKENVMSELVFTEQALPELHLVQVTGTVEDMSQVGGVVPGLFERLMSAAGPAGLDLEAPSYAWYQDDTEGGPVLLGAGIPVEEGRSVPGTEPGHLPAEPRAIVVTHVGDMASIGGTWQELARYAAAKGLTLSGVCREKYISTPEGREDEWVTELQQPV